MWEDMRTTEEDIMDMGTTQEEEEEDTMEDMESMDTGTGMGMGRRMRVMYGFSAFVLLRVLGQMTLTNPLLELKTPRLPLLRLHFNDGDDDDWTGRIGAVHAPCERGVGRCSDAYGVR